MIGFLLAGWLATAGAGDAGAADPVRVVVVGPEGEPLGALVALHCARGPVVVSLTDPAGEALLRGQEPPCELTIRAVGFEARWVLLESLPTELPVRLTERSPLGETIHILPRSGWTPTLDYGPPAPGFVLSEAHPPGPGTLVFHRDVLARLPVTRSVAGVSHLAGAVGAPAPLVLLDGLVVSHPSMPPWPTPQARAAGLTGFPARGGTQ